MDLSILLVLSQLFFGTVMGLYFFNLFKTQRNSRVAIDKDSHKELTKLNAMRQKRLSEPLSERTRPKAFEDIVGQEEGIKALKAALCSPNPQHVIIYGPPGVGKTCAARLVLEDAKHARGTPFANDATFIEVDATCVRFDERAIADPLIGSVHDPIYQGAGAMGIAGIPQPKPGAVTKAHGGVLFLDEIGEIHPVQMNKLLKILEDRKVFLESAYYNSEDANTPKHIHDIFQNGLPADFRLIGATTRSPGDIPAAIRSRCLEVFFRPLRAFEIVEIARGAAKRGGFKADEAALTLVGEYADNGRDAVNIIQLSCGLAHTEGRRSIEKADIEWVIETCRYHPRREHKAIMHPKVGLANGLAVTGGGAGLLLEVEALAMKTEPGRGRLTVTGMVDEEEMSGRDRKLKRKSTARASVENCVSALKRLYGFDFSALDVHINLPGGAPVDGPSAGAAISVALMSAITGRPPERLTAYTGEVSIGARICPVGGVKAKVEAALEAGAKRVVIPADNWQESFSGMNIEVCSANNLEEVIALAFRDEQSTQKNNALLGESVLSAQGV